MFKLEVYYIFKKISVLFCHISYFVFQMHNFLLQFGIRALCMELLGMRCWFVKQ